MAQSLESRLEPIKAQLRQALAALDRVTNHEYLPHQVACVSQAKEHLKKSTDILNRIPT